MVQVNSIDPRVRGQTTTKPATTNSRQPIWRTVVKVVLVVVIIAAAIYFGRIVIPKVITFVRTAATTAAAVVSAATAPVVATGKLAGATAELATDTIGSANTVVKTANKVLNKPLIKTAAEAMVSGVQYIVDQASGVTSVDSEAWANVKRQLTFRQFLISPIKSVINWITGK